MPNQSNRPIKLAVIGHTNVGKTSLMRTLLRNEDFGEVKNASATTRHVEMATLHTQDGIPLVALYDTPGLEDGSGVMDFIVEHTDGRADGVDRLRAFLEAVSTQSNLLDGDYSQEAKVITALLSSQVALYVIDTREPISSKYKDELAILASSGIPILPVFNFIKDKNTQFEAWKDMLSRRALHVYNLFDTIAFDFDSEMTLWENLGTMTHHQAFHTLKDERTKLWQQMSETGSVMIADFLINVASFHQKIGEHDDPEPVLNAMQHTTHQAFNILQDRLLELYKFYHTPLQQDELIIHGSEQDMFDGEFLARYGIRTAGGSIAGIVIGASIDVATLGASLGLGTAIGSVVGGLLPNSTTIKDKALGIKTLNISDDTLLILATKSQALHHTLRHLGHANLNQINISHQDHLVWQLGKLPTPLKKARTYPNYCSLNESYDAKKHLRSTLANELSETLLEHLLQPKSV